MACKKKEDKLIPLQFPSRIEICILPAQSNLIKVQEIIPKKVELGFLPRSSKK